MYTWNFVERVDLILHVLLCCSIAQYRTTLWNATVCGKPCPSTSSSVHLKFYWESRSNITCSFVLFNSSVSYNSLKRHGLWQALSFNISRSLVKPMSIGLVMPSNHLILCRPFSWSFLASGPFPVSQLYASGGQSVGV